LQVYFLLAVPDTSRLHPNRSIFGRPSLDYFDIAVEEPLAIANFRASTVMALQLQRRESPPVASQRRSAKGYLLVAVGDHDGAPGAGGFAIAVLPRVACIPFCAPDVISTFLILRR
jgi:hypothetical protein